MSDVINLEEIFNYPDCHQTKYDGVSVNMLYNV